MICVRVVVVREQAPGERRVAAVPDTVTKLRGAGYEVSIESGAGSGSQYSDEAYSVAGAEVSSDRSQLLSGAQILLAVAPPELAVVAGVPAEASILSLLAPAANAELLRAIAARGLTAFGLEMVPRISRAQSMDALSSQALVGGYRAVLLAATRLGKFFPMFMTAAGTVPPARVLVLGAGVAGLQAIATARRLGAVVEAYDVRAAAGEEVRSLGATFLELPLEAQEGTGGYARAQSEDFLARQRQLLSERIAVADVVVTTAAVPGRRAPVLVTAEMVDGMRPGSVIVDLAADTGGNCELTQPGADVDHAGVTVVGLTGAPSQVPIHASALYARNVTNLLLLMTKDGALVPDWTDEIVTGCCLVRAGQIVHPAAQEAVSAMAEEGSP
ncbi:MAG: Re/Si-specific NAD(P)(+) transhydrogenase subunit alpha [Mycobacteriales bacterium]